MANANRGWLTSFVDISDPACELVCFPHAGGGGSIFRTWQRHTKALHIAALRLPGREHRLSERPLADLELLVDALVDGLAATPGWPPQRPYGLYGHSMGALVAFELTRRLRSIGVTLPAGLFVAGSDAPQLLNPERAHDLPRHELVDWLSNGNGLAPEALCYPELIDLMLPTIRADLAVVENYHYRSQAPLPLPIHVFRGCGDPQTSAEGSAGWAEQTSAECVVTHLTGGHFFVRDHEDHVVSLIEADLVKERAKR